MLVLVINCGSSSLKYQLLEMTTETLMAKGLVERIGIEGSVIKHETIGKEKYVLTNPPIKDFYNSVYQNMQKGENL